jgi:hypothetical protein
MKDSFPRTNAEFYKESKRKRTFAGLPKLARDLCILVAEKPKRMQNSSSRHSSKIPSERNLPFCKMEYLPSLHLTNSHIFFLIGMGCRLCHFALKSSEALVR